MEHEGLTFSQAGDNMFYTWCYLRVQSVAEHIILSERVMNGGHVGFLYPLLMKYDGHFNAFYLLKPKIICVIATYRVRFVQKPEGGCLVFLSGGYIREGMVRN